MRLQMGTVLHRAGTCLALAILLSLPVLAGCSAAKVSQSQSPASVVPGAGFLGYWRLVSPVWDSPGADMWRPQLLSIRLVGRSYVWKAPREIIQSPLARPISGGPLTPQGQRLVARKIENGRVVWQDVLSLSRDGTELAVSESGGQPRFNIVMTYRRATGSAAQLAAEMAGWSANVTILKQLPILTHAIDRWRAAHGPNSRFPPRSAFLPNGSFWRWPHAPHLTNALTGRPMRLNGDAPGDFFYSTSPGRNSYQVTVHLYGGTSIG